MSTFLKGPAGGTPLTNFIFLAPISSHYIVRKRKLLLKYSYSAIFGGIREIHEGGWNPPYPRVKYKAMQCNSIRVGNMS